jgi:uncharacterized membrane protein
MSELGGRPVIQVDRLTLAAIRRLSIAALAAGWVVYALLGRDSQVFLVVMIVLSMVLFATIGVVVRRRDDR